jgi:16S rRNA (cytidine1402-2'-O)-methyltransferase
MRKSSAHYKAAGAPKGEVVIVISPPAHTASSVTNEELDAALRDALSAFSLRDAVDAVAGSHSQPRRVVYARAIALKKALPKI